jgi:outer membrane immunogenic protein
LNFNIFAYRVKVRSMTTRRTLAAAALALAALIDSAYAQSRPDLPPYSAGPSWTGFYVGADFGGGGAVRRSTASPGGGAAINVDGLGGGGILASVHGGFDYQLIPQAVVGLMVEGTWSNMTGSTSAQVPGANANISHRADLGLAILARAGVLVTPSSLLYAVGGYAGQNFHTTGTAAAGGAFRSFDADSYFNGWTVGGGLETMLRGGWSAKLEYRFSQFETKLIPAGGVSEQPFLHTARVGLSYRFGAGHESTEEPVASGRRDWTGVYGGVAGGAGLLTNRLNASVGGASAAIDNDGQGLLGSVFVGGDYQVSDQVLVGLLGDLTWPGMQSMLTAGGAGGSSTVATRTNMGWNVVGRVGWLATPSALLYALGGYTNQSFTTTGYANGSTIFSSEDRLGGFVVGPGLEFMIAKGWSTRLEYRYSQYESHTLLSGVTIQPSSHTVRAGLAYKFGVN